MNHFKKFEVCPLDPTFHNGQNFREQIATLRIVGNADAGIKVIRSFFSVCQPGLASFDKSHPGADSLEAWQTIDDLIENGGIRGTFHTHPTGFLDFSGVDINTFSGLAMANGSRFLYHGVQALGSDKAHFVLCNMLAGRVHLYDLGWIESDLNDPVLILPPAPVIKIQDNILCFDLT